MKHINHSLLRSSFLFGLMIVLAFSSRAQLSGTKVIGAAPSDFATFTAAVTALTSQGVNGPVVFQVKSGIYNEKITIGAITGASATNTITFTSQTGDSSDVTLMYASSNSLTDNFVVYLNGADYIKFSHLTIQRTGTLNYAEVIEISNGATYNTIEYCHIEGTSVASTTTFTVLVASSNTLEDSYNTFQHNMFVGGSMGLNLIGRGSSMLDPGLVITNNVFAYQNSKGVSISYMDDAIINDNSFVTNSANSSYIGIYGLYANNDLRILRNRMALSIGSGIYLTTSSVTGLSVMLIANNFIAVNGASTNYGILLNQVQYANVYYNSVNLTTSTAGRACNISGASATAINLMNNSFVNAGGGYAIYVDANTVSPLQGSNYNNLFTTGANVGFWQAAGNQATLADWRTAATMDAQSISADALYVSTTDLHATSGALNGKATTSLSSSTPVTTDIDGETRSSSKPDIGADEFNSEDLGICAVGSYPILCEHTSTTITCYIKNYTDYTFEGAVPVYYQLSGESAVNANTGLVTINANDSIPYVFTQTAYLQNAGAVSFICGTGLLIDINNANDINGTGLINVSPAPSANAGNDVYVCMGDSVTLIATGGTTYSWNTTPATLNDTLHLLVSDTTDFIVTVVSNDGCVAWDTVRVIPGVFPVPTAEFFYTPSDMHYYFTDASTDATGWNWDFGDGNFSTQQNPDHIYGSNANYDVTLIAYNGCYADTITKQITVFGIDEGSAARLISLAPNPANETVSILGIQPLDILTIIAYDILGKVVLTIENPTTEMLDVSRLQNGTYTLVVKTNQAFFRKTLSVQR